MMENTDITLDDEVLDESLDEDPILQATTNGSNGNPADESAAIDEVTERLRELEEEAAKLKEIQTSLSFNTSNVSVSSSQSNTTPAPFLTPEEKAEIDARSVYVGNVEYSANPEQLEEHFRGCGPIERVTILSDKYTGHPKGFAYIQFTEVDGMQNALALDESLFLGRQIKVNMKRTNKPGFSTTNRPPRGRGMMRGRGRGFYGGFRGMRGRPNRRRGFAPY